MKKRMPKTQRKGGRYLSLWDPGNYIPDMVSEKVLVEDPESEGASQSFENLRPLSQKMFATVTSVPLFHSPLRGVDLLFYDWL